MLSPQKLSDQELLSLLKIGNQHGFTEIFNRYQPLVLRHALSILDDVDAANDAAQDVFMHLWERRESLEIHSTLPAYLYIAARNRILKAIRHSKTEATFLATLAQTMEETTVSIDEALNEKELRRRFEQEMSLLPPKTRQAFELSRKYEHSYREIGEIMQLSGNTVKHHISHALKVMRGKLQILFFFL